MAMTSSIPDIVVETQKKRRKKLQSRLSRGECLKKERMKSIYKSIYDKCKY